VAKHPTDAYSEAVSTLEVEIERLDIQHRAIAREYNAKRTELAILLCPYKVGDTVGRVVMEGRGKIIESSSRRGFSLGGPTREQVPTTRRWIVDEIKPSRFTLSKQSYTGYGRRINKNGLPSEHRTEIDYGVDVIS
jgi:hypothetical protein